MRRWPKRVGRRARLPSRATNSRHPRSHPFHTPTRPLAPYGVRFEYVGTVSDAKYLLFQECIVTHKEDARIGVSRHQIKKWVYGTRRLWLSTHSNC